ncbi:hypothetical protein MKW98_029294 [Papaver atlanticum]|uniref:KIB1-4 beta-propeller domain-containing protein n=1 Tax=Papaver atlanticum TaxID=357466 RepID=A0AAD4XFQ6_9MAGN|nr:hypothetical protein MKW98_029294 [Papaver atlanticum]
MDKQLESESASTKSSSHEISEIQRPPVPKASPWLVFPHGKGRKFQSFYNPCEPNNRNCIKSIPEMQGRAYYHKPSHQGWLIVIGNVEDEAEFSVAISDLNDFFLWNPVSSETIQLPSLDRQSFSTESKEYFLFDLVLSSPPRSTSNSNPAEDLNCVVYLLYKCVDHDVATEDKHVLAFCRPGDKQWRTKVLSINAPGDDAYALSIESLLCFKGELYAFCKESHFKDNWLIKFETQKLWHHVVNNKETKYVTIIDIGYADFTWIGGGEQYSRYTEHWVESGNEIFKVHLNCSPRGFRKVASTHIFQLNLSSMTWVSLKTLDDHVLFLSISTDIYDTRKCYSTSTACCSAAAMGLERGCLFYTLLQDQTLYAFEIEDSATTVIMPCLELPTPWFLPTWIMMPTTENSHLAGRRRRITNILVSQDTTETKEKNMSRLNSNGAELEALNQWDFLNHNDCTEEIGRFLHPVDYIHFRLACKQNALYLPALNQKSASTRATTTTYLSSWLISIFEDNEKTICDIVDPMHNDRYVIKLSDQFLVGAVIRFSKDGWLLLSKGKKSVLCYNPFTREIIRLPDLPDDYVMGGMSFSSIPTSSDCVVFIISNWYEICGYNGISFCVIEPRKSETGWTVRDFDYEDCTLEDYVQYMDNFMPCINNPVFYNGAFYCLDYNGMLGVFNMKGDHSWSVLPKSLKQFGGFDPSYLVECDEKLLLVSLGQGEKSVDIYRLDDSEMVWVKLNSLGKHALFISNTSSFSAVAPRSCMENKIYFSRLFGERILYYSLDTCRYHCVGSDQHSLQDFHNTKERLSCAWIEPRWS